MTALTLPLSATATPAAAIPKGMVVAMGNFDGVHLGHRAVIARRAAHGAGAWPAGAGGDLRAASAQFFSPNTPQFRLTDEAGKAAAIGRRPGLAGAVVMTFDKAPRRDQRRRISFTMI